jgi:putative transposase
MIDTQSVDTERQGSPGRGRDPSKQVTGRKRHVIVDTLGLLLAVFVHPANEHDKQMAPPVLNRLLRKVVSR